MSRPVILVTRPQAEAAALAATLEAEGWRALICPVLEVRPTGASADLAAAQAVLFTSARAARLAAPAPIPALCVGDATAFAARATGFADVRSAAGDAAALERLAAETLDPSKGPVAFLRGADVAGDLAGALRARGFTVRERVLYAAVPADTLEPAAADALREGRVDVVAVWSPRAAQAFALLAGPASSALSRSAAVAISAAAAAPLRALGFARVTVAARPDAAAMADAIATARPWGASAQRRAGLDAATDATNVAARAVGEDPSMSTERNPDEAATQAASGQPAAGGVGHDAAPAQDDVSAAARREQAREADLAPQDAEIVEAAAPIPASKPAAPSPAAPASGGWASKALAALVLLIAGAAGAIVAGPSLAPMLPAPVAAFLKPADDESAAALAALRARLDSVAAAAAKGEAAADLAETALAAATASTDRLATLDTRIGALEKAPKPAAPVAAAAPTAAAPTAAAPVDAGRLAALETAVAAARTGLEAQARDLAALKGAVPAPGALDALAKRLDALDAAVVAEAAARAEVVAASAAARDTARDSLTLSAALAQIDRALVEGAPFASALSDATAAASAAPPSALVEAAVLGAPTREALKIEFAAAAHAAIGKALEVEAAADPGVLSGLLARVEARFTGLPAEPIEGDGAQAVLSRAKAALLNGDLDGAIAILDALPPEVASAMADWSAGAKARIGAEAALASWRAEIGAAL